MKQIRKSTQFDIWTIQIKGDKMRREKKNVHRFETSKTF